MTDADIDYAQDFDQLSDVRLDELACRIEQSSTIEHLIYRELEIDQVWRLLDQGSEAAGLSASQQQELGQQIVTIHDLVGIHHNAPAAAATLRAVLSRRG